MNAPLTLIPVPVWDVQTQEQVFQPAASNQAEFSARLKLMPFLQQQKLQRAMNTNQTLQRMAAGQVRITWQ